MNKSLKQDEVILNGEEKSFNEQTNAANICGRKRNRKSTLD